MHNAYFFGGTYDVPTKTSVIASEGGQNEELSEMQTILV